jgi:hypothetical protein
MNSVQFKSVRIVFAINAASRAGGLLRHGATLDTGAASGAQICFNTAGPFFDFNLKVSSRSFNGFNV